MFILVTFSRNLNETDELQTIMQKQEFSFLIGYSSRVLKLTSITVTLYFPFNRTTILYLLF